MRVGEENSGSAQSPADVLNWPDSAARKICTKLGSQCLHQKTPQGIKSNCRLCIHSNYRKKILAPKASQVSVYDISTAAGCSEEISLQRVIHPSHSCHALGALIERWAATLFFPTQNLYAKRAVTRKRKVAQKVWRCQNGPHAEGYKRPGAKHSP